MVSRPHTLRACKPTVCICRPCVRLWCERSGRLVRKQLRDHDPRMRFLDEGARARWVWRELGAVAVGLAAIQRPTGRLVGVQLTRRIFQPTGVRARSRMLDVRRRHGQTARRLETWGLGKTRWHVGRLCIGRRLLCEPLFLLRSGGSLGCSSTWRRPTVFLFLSVLTLQPSFFLDFGEVDGRDSLLRSEARTWLTGGCDGTWV